MMPKAGSWRRRRKCGLRFTVDQQRPTLRHDRHASRRHRLEHQTTPGAANHHRPRSGVLAERDGSDPRWAHPRRNGGQVVHLLARQGSVYLHRSWTGNCTYVVHFFSEGDAWRGWKPPTNTRHICGENLLPAPDHLRRAAEVDLPGREQADAAVPVLGVVPGEERAAERLRLLGVCEPAGEAGVILDRLELGLRVRVVVRDPGAAQRPPRLVVFRGSSGSAKGGHVAPSGTGTGSLRPRDCETPEPVADPSAPGTHRPCQDTRQLLRARPASEPPLRGPGIRTLRIPSQLPGSGPCPCDHRLRP